jgi:cytochrome P450
MMADKGSLDSESPEAGAGCPVTNITEMDVLIPFVRSKLVEHRPELFADIASDPVNGAINVKEFLSGSVIYEDGKAHLQRRKMLNQLVRPDALDVIREDIILPAASILLEQRLEAPDGDGVYRIDLIELLERVFLNFTAKLIGLIGVDTDEGMTRLRACASPLAAGTSSAFLDDRDSINEIAVAAKTRYIEEFFDPSLEAYRALLQQVEDGELDESELPNNLIGFIARKANAAYEDRNSAIVESTMLFSASVGTSTQSLVHTIHYLQDWFAKHPEDYQRRTDMEFLQRSLQETIRLRSPFSPFTTRMPSEECTIAGHEYHAGQEVRIEWVAANRDPKVFGEDSYEWNPNRPSPEGSGLPRYGVGFGTGAHQCFGLRVVLGNDGESGAHVKLLQRLMEVGIEPDPANPPESLKKNMSKFRIEDIPRYTKYPVVFTSWESRDRKNGVEIDG